MAEPIPRGGGQETLAGTVGTTRSKKRLDIGRLLRIAEDAQLSPSICDTKAASLRKWTVAHRAGGSVTVPATYSTMAILPEFSRR